MDGQNVEVKAEKEAYESMLTPKQQEGFFAILDKVRSGLLTNLQAEEAMYLFANKCDEEDTQS